MESRARSPLWCAAIGAFSGARTTLGPLLACERVLDSGGEGAVPAKWLQSGSVATMIGVLAIVETAVDKVPFIPERTRAIALVPRVGAGAFAGAALSSVDRSARRRDVIVGALFGAAGAVAGAFAAVHVRRLLARGLPDVLAGIGEDALLVALSRTVLARMA